MLAIFGANVAAYSNPTELWQVRANETGMDVSNPSTWNTQLDPTNPWAADHGVNAMQQGAQRLNENAYNQANGTGPALNMVQGADGNWTNTNADANQLYLQNKINALNPSPTQPQGVQQTTQQQPNTPASFWNNATAPHAPAAQTQNTPYPNPVEAWQVRANDAASGAPTAQDNFWAQANAPTNPASNNTMQASDFTYSGSDPWSPTGTQETTAAGMGYKQDASGNWYNPNYQAPAAPTQQAPVQPTATQQPIQSVGYKQDASGKWYNPDAIQSSIDSNNATSLGYVQNANGEWYNPNSTTPTSSNPNQSAIDAYMEANPGDWTIDNYAAFQKLSDTNYKVPPPKADDVNSNTVDWEQVYKNSEKTDTAMPFSEVTADSPYQNPTENWQFLANATGMDASNPDTWGKQLDPSNPWANNAKVKQMQQGWKDMQVENAQRAKEQLAFDAIAGGPSTVAGDSGYGSTPATTLDESSVSPLTNYYDAYTKSWNDLKGVQGKSGYYSQQQDYSKGIADAGIKGLYQYLSNPDAHYTNDQVGAFLDTTYGAVRSAVLNKYIAEMSAPTNAYTGNLSSVVHGWTPESYAKAEAEAAALFKQAFGVDPTSTANQASALSESRALTQEGYDNYTNQKNAAYGNLASQIGRDLSTMDTGALTTLFKTAGLGVSQSGALAKYNEKKAAAKAAADLAAKQQLNTNNLLNSYAKQSGIKSPLSSLSLG